MDWIVGTALAVTLALVAWRRVFVAFGLYLALETVKWWLYREGGTAVYLAWEPWVLTARIAAAIEAWALMTWIMNAGERLNLLAGSVGAGLAAVWIAWWTWPVDVPVTMLNQVRLSTHLLCCSALLVAVLWLLIHPVRQRGLLYWHAVTMTIYCGLFSWAGLQRAATQTEWDEARLIFRCGLILLLTAFAGQQFFQRRDSRFEALHISA